MAYIELEGMEFHAFHGCFKEERIVGNKFIVYFSFTAVSENAETSDDINDTINYQNVYQIIKAEMMIPSHLLEHVARRILDKVKLNFPKIQKAEVKVSKLNPSMGGKIRNVSVTIAM